MNDHYRAVETIADSIRDFAKLGQSYRVYHGSSHSTRPRHGPGQNLVDISKLCRVLDVNIQQRTCLVEPNVPMDRLVEATLPYGLVPPVVMEFPGITAGGGFSGTSGESSSFRHGFFNEQVNFVEMILGDGSIVRASRDERADLFFGAAGAAGTLGITTLLELRLVEAKDYVRVTYRRMDSVSSAVAQIGADAGRCDIDYVDGILYSKDHGVIVTGQLTNTKPPGHPIRTFSHAGDPWYYLHVQDLTRTMPPSSRVDEYVPLSEYLFRYDRAGFWVGRQGYTYFKLVPFNWFFRWLLDDYSHTRTLYHALHASRISSRFIIQDLGLPYDQAETFVNWVDQELGIWPVWLCPLKGCSTPTFHPVTQASTIEPAAEPQAAKPAAEGTSQPMLNVGVWGWGPDDHEDFVSKNRGLERELTRLRGRKWLYAHTYYTNAEFWSIYDASWYQALRAKYAASSLPTIYDKVKVRTCTKQESAEIWGTSWLSKWPVGGLYGMVLATLSGDIGLHRRATWRYRKK